MRLLSNGYEFGCPRWKQPNLVMNNSIVELYENGTISYLFKKGLVSSVVPSYIEYFIKFSSYRKDGITYREAVRMLSNEYHVSETTIKKAIKTIKEGVN